MIYKEVTLVFLKSGHSHNARDSLTSKLKKPLADGAVYDLHTIVDKFNNVHNKETTTPTKTMTKTILELVQFEKLKIILTLENLNS